MLKIYHWVGMIICCLIFITSNASLAQSNLPQPVYEGIYYLRNISWSADSQILVFNEPLSENGVNVTDESWIQYDTVSEQIRKTNRWPLQPVFTQTEQQLFNPAIFPSGENTFIFNSPNDQYVVYAGELDANNPSDFSWSIKLGNRQQNEVANISIQVAEPFWGTDDFNVQWNETGTRFVLTASTLVDTSWVYHVDNYTNSLLATEVILVQVPINNYLYTGFEAYDLSTSGGEVLIYANEYSASSSDPNSPLFRLLLWDEDNPSHSRVISNVGYQVKGAIFHPQDENKILAVNDLGLIEYNLMTNAITTLNSDVNSSWVDKAVFSPNGNWLALYEETDEGYGKIYVLNIFD